MKKAVSILLCWIGMLVLVLSSCSYTAKYTYTPTNNVEIYTAEDERAEWIQGETYTSARARYSFEETLSDKQKDGFIDMAEKVLDEVPLTDVKFVVGNSFGTGYVGNVRNAKGTSQREIDKIYFNIEEASPINILLELNAKKYGEKTPYGLLYALSFGECVEAGYELPRLLKDKELKETLGKNRDVTDLNAFVFLSSFTTEEEKRAAETLSAKMYEEVGLEKIKEIVETGDVERQQNVMNFLVKSVCYKLQIASLLQAGMTGYECSHTQKYIVAENEELNVRFFVVKDFQVAEIEPRMHGYKDLKECLVLSPDSFKKVNEFVGNATPIPADYYCYDRSPSSSVADYVTCRIELGAFCETVHEYTHIAMSESYHNGHWTVEGMASYCDAAFSMYGETEWLLNATINFGEENEQISRRLEMLKEYPPADAMEFWDMMGYIEESMFPGKMIETAYGHTVFGERAGIAFSNYLVKTYGKEKYVELSKTYKTEEEVYGKSLDTLRSEWFESLQQKYTKEAN